LLEFCIGLPLFSSPNFLNIFFFLKCSRMGQIYYSRLIHWLEVLSWACVPFSYLSLPNGLEDAGCVYSMSGTLFDKHAWLAVAFLSAKCPKAVSSSWYFLGIKFPPYLSTLYIQSKQLEGVGGISPLFVDQP